MNLLEQFQTLDWRDPGRWPLLIRTIVASFVFVVAAFIFSMVLIYNTQMEEYDQVQAEQDSLWAEFEQKQHQAANFAAYRAQLKDMERSFGAMLRQLPGRTEVPNLLVDISQTGLAAGLDEKLFQPGTEMKQDFYAELPIKIRLTGSYHEFGNFVSGIAALPRIVTLHDIQIQMESAKGAGTDQLVLDLIAKTYRYLEDDEMAAAAKGKGKGKPGQEAQP
jgi:type IV pilus assembly protein PilO